MENDVKKEVFCWSGETEPREPYAYTECGLDNIYIVNGYTVRDLDGDEFISVHDVDGLHVAISRHLVMHRKGLSGKEIRFIRNTMNLTQKELAEKLGNDSQTVARWEKETSDIPGPSEKLLRAVFLASVAETDEDMHTIRTLLNSLLGDLDEMDSTGNEQAQFEFSESWSEAA